jgi:hypothetical protein
VGGNPDAPYRGGCASDASVILRRGFSKLDPFDAHRKQFAGIQFGVGIKPTSNTEGRISQRERSFHEKKDIPKEFCGGS